MKKIRPGATVTVDFRGLPRTLYSMIQNKSVPAKMTFHLPENYSPEKRFPLLLWINGGDGGKAVDLTYPRRLAKGLGMVCLTLPLFKRNLAKLKPDKSNYWARMYLNDRHTHITTWRCYKVMLERFFRLVPNIERTKTFMGGFSNGANVTALLLNRPRSEITRHFNHFYFMEGGNHFTRTACLRKRDLLVMYGNRHNWGKQTQVRINKYVVRLVRRARAGGVNCEFLLARGVGHVIAPVFTRRLRKWIKERI